VEIASRYRDEVICATVGGQSTTRTTNFDTFGGWNMWPKEYDGRTIISLTVGENESGVAFGEIQVKYSLALEAGDQGWGREGRLVTYAGTGVGLIRNIRPAEEIVEEIRETAGIGQSDENTEREIFGVKVYSIWERLVLQMSYAIVFSTDKLLFPSPGAFVFLVR
jgi:hypothetical protein